MECPFHEVENLQKRSKRRNVQQVNTKRASREFPSSLLGAVAPDRVNRIPLFLAHRLLADVRQTRGRRVEDTIKTVADVEDAGK